MTIPSMLEETGVAAFADRVREERDDLWPGQISFWLTPEHAENPLSFLFDDGSDRKASEAELAEYLRRNAAHSEFVAPPVLRRLLPDHDGELLALLAERKHGYHHPGVDLDLADSLARIAETPAATVAGLAMKLDLLFNATYGLEGGFIPERQQRQILAEVRWWLWDRVMKAGLCEPVPDFNETETRAWLRRLYDEYTPREVTGLACRLAELDTGDLAAVSRIVERLLAVQPDDEGGQDDPEPGPLRASVAGGAHNRKGFTLFAQIVASPDRCHDPLPEPPPRSPAAEAAAHALQARVEALATEYSRPLPEGDDGLVEAWRRIEAIAADWASLSREFGPLVGDSTVENTIEAVLAPVDDDYLCGHIDGATPTTTAGIAVKLRRCVAHNGCGNDPELAALIDMVEHVG